MSPKRSIDSSIRLDSGMLVSFAAILAGLVVAWAATYFSGGTHRAFPHMFYIPVIFAAYRFGLRGGLITGVLAMIGCGPLIPLDVVDGVPQTVENWMTRGAFFIAIGGVAGIGAQTLRDRYERSNRLHEDAVRAFVKTIDAKSPYTAKHSERVAELAAATAREMHLPDDQVENIRWAALLHDVGKLWVPDHVINKLTPLSDAEWALIRDHPIRSAEFISEIEDFQKYYDAARSHHERFDGGGYPDGLSGYDIPLDARILGVADAFEAMTSDRPYRRGLTFREALAEVDAHSGSQFDPVIVRACIRAVESQPATLHHWRSTEFPLPRTRAV